MCHPVCNKKSPCGSLSNQAQVTDADWTLTAVGDREVCGDGSAASVSHIVFLLFLSFLLFDNSGISIWLIPKIKCQNMMYAGLRIWQGPVLVDLVFASEKAWMYGSYCMVWRKSTQVARTWKEQTLRNLIWSICLQLSETKLIMLLWRKRCNGSECKHVNMSFINIPRPNSINSCLLGFTSWYGRSLNTNYKFSS